jgi:hypothetical protein
MEQENALMEQWEEGQEALKGISLSKTMMNDGGGR